jgi:hypothetical protein
MSIEITHVVPPEQGWPIAGYCAICRAHHIVLSPFALKPEDGMLFIADQTCLNEPTSQEHTLDMSLRNIWHTRRMFNVRGAK